MRLALLAIALLVGCSETPALSAPRYADGRRITYRIGHLREAMGIAIYPEHAIVLDRAWLDLPPAERDFVVAHEWCHLDGYEAEADADCCALAYLELTGLYSDLELAQLVGRLSWDSGRAVRLLECSP